VLDLGTDEFGLATRLGLQKSRTGSRRSVRAALCSHFGFLCLWPFLSVVLDPTADAARLAANLGVQLALWTRLRLQLMVQTAFVPAEVATNKCGRLMARTFD
jgi:hypothetical protein